MHITYRFSQTNLILSLFLHKILFSRNFTKLSTKKDFLVYLFSFIYFFHSIEIFILRISTHKHIERKNFQMKTHFREHSENRYRRMSKLNWNWRIVFFQDTKISVILLRWELTQQPWIFSLTFPCPNKFQRCEVLFQDKWEIYSLSQAFCWILLVHSIPNSWLEDLRATVLPQGILCYQLGNFFPTNTH